MERARNQKWIIRVVGGALAGLTVVACGPASRPVPTHTPSPSSLASIAPERVSSRATAADLSLNVTEVAPAAEQFLPPGETLHLAGQQVFGGMAGTLERDYTTGDGVYGAQVDVVPYNSVFLAENDYANAQSYASNPLDSVMHSTPGIGNEADEYVGHLTSGSSTTGAAAITFREKDVLVVVVWESRNGVVIPDIAEAIAKAEDARIVDRD